MPQWLLVLRGCLTAYLTGVLVFGFIAQFDGPATGAEVFGLALIFGGLIALPFTLIALAVWAILASRSKRVTLLQAAAICAGAFFFGGLFLSFGVGPLSARLVALVILPLVGGLFGAVFWFGAFGRRYEVQFGPGEPPP